jgi:hypothetical protein
MCFLGAHAGPLYPVDKYAVKNKHIALQDPYRATVATISYAFNIFLPYCSCVNVNFVLVFMARC